MGGKHHPHSTLKRPPLYTIACMMLGLVLVLGDAWKCCPCPLSLSYSHESTSPDRQVQLAFIDIIYIHISISPPNFAKDGVTTPNLGSIAFGPTPAFARSNNVTSIAHCLPRPFDQRSQRIALPSLILQGTHHGLHRATEADHPAESRIAQCSSSGSCRGEGTAR